MLEEHFARRFWEISSFLLIELKLPVAALKSLGHCVPRLFVPAYVNQLIFDKLPKLIQSSDKEPRFAVHTKKELKFETSDVQNWEADRERWRSRKGVKITFTLNKISYPFSKLLKATIEFGYNSIGSPDNLYVTGQAKGEFFNCYVSSSNWRNVLHFFDQILDSAATDFS
jgi:hypothetical protein